MNNNLKIAIENLQKAIEVREDAPKSVPNKYKGIKNFADETNKKYPLDDYEHARAAISYFGMPKDYEKYKPEDRKKIAHKIVSAAKKFEI